MTLAADARHGIYTRRTRPMIAVAVITTWGSEIVPIEQRRGVNTFSIFLELIRWNLVRRHPGRICVTLCACRSDLRRVHRRLRITDAADIMNTVAARAGRNILVSARISHPVHAGLILGKLIDAHLRI